MNLIFAFLLLFPLQSFAKVKADLSGNIEAQTRHAWNNQEAKDLAQDWKQKDFHLLYGNLNGKVELDESRIEANWFVRYSNSQLYKNNYVAPLIYTYPNNLVARNVFKLESRDASGQSVTESVLNKLYYEWDYEEHRFMVGRMYINYGVGEIFNPINPFNQPTGLTSIQQVAQGNDGFNFTFYVNDKHTVDFYLLGDKDVPEYENQITKTFWVHGEYQFNEKLQLDYVVGEDQKRGKIGGQINYKLDEAMTFAQVLYQSDYVDNTTPSSNLLDVLVGYDQQLNNKWHVRLESGYQEKNKYQPANSFSTRFLPVEYFAALALVDEIHPLIKLNGTIVNDIKSGFTYLIAKSTFDLGQDIEAEFFGFAPVAKGDKIEYQAQKLVTTDLGVALRAFF